jgi:hypothetical protein
MSGIEFGLNLAARIPIPPLSIERMVAPGRSDLAAIRLDPSLRSKDGMTRLSISTLQRALHGGTWSAYVQPRDSLRKPTTFPRNSLLAARLACWFQAESWIPELFGRYPPMDGIETFRRQKSCFPSSKVSINRPLSFPLRSRRGEGKASRATARAGPGHLGAPSFVVEQELFWETIA